MVVSAGEVMLELAPVGCGERYQRAFAGDSFNTAVYLARAGMPVRYLTRLGDDAGSREVLELMREEGIDSNLVAEDAGCNIGLYLIANDQSGERTFTYYRDSSPARRLFDLPLALPADVFYFTGITLAVTRTGQANLLALLEALKAAGAQVVFDPNYRPVLWDDPQQARDSLIAVLPFCDLLLPTQGDDLALWGAATAADSISFYSGYGASEVVVKGENLEVVAWTAERSARQRADAVAAVDTTGAGDAFNAGYLASRLSGADLEPALQAAQALAAEVVRHHGALIPRAEAELPRNPRKQGES